MQAATEYTITATGLGGSTSRNFTLQITYVTPYFSLTATSKSLQRNVAYFSSDFYSISTAASGGTVDTYLISPALPTGLVFDSQTGLITGTPTAAQTSSTYTITGTNTSGSYSRTFALAITG